MKQNSPTHSLPAHDESGHDTSRHDMSMQAPSVQSAPADGSLFKPEVRRADMLLHTGMIRGLLSRIDYQDTFEAELPQGCTLPLHVLAHHMFAHSPKAVERLMRLRDMIVGPLGLKTAGKAARTRGTTAPSGDTIPEPAIGDRLGIFRLAHKEENLLLFKESDTHLEFVLALERVTENSTENRADKLRLSTCVRFNNTLGRAYFLVVRPFHERIVPMCMREGLERLK